MKVYSAEQHVEYEGATVLSLHESPAGAREACREYAIQFRRHLLEWKEEDTEVWVSQSNSDMHFYIVRVREVLS